MLKLLTSYCLFLTASLTFAQSTDNFSVTGKMISGNTGNPIQGGIIKLTNIKGVTGDSLGQFTIYDLPQGQHTLSFSAFGYDNKDTTILIGNSSITNLVLTIWTKCNDYNNNKALQDIKTNKAKLLLQSGFAPIVYSTDQDFEKEFGVKYYDFGCDATVRQDCIKTYNQTIFNYLDKKFGTKWRRKVRQDVLE